MKGAARICSTARVPVSRAPASATPVPQACHFGPCTMHHAPHRLFRGAGAEDQHVCRTCHLPDAAEVDACNFGAAAPPLRRLHRSAQLGVPAFVRTAEELARGATELHVDHSSTRALVAGSPGICLRPDGGWRRAAGGDHALNELLFGCCGSLPGALLNRLARPLRTSVPAIKSCRPCLRSVHATIRKPMPTMSRLRNLAR